MTTKEVYEKMLNDFFDIDSEPIVVDMIKEIDPKICLEGHWEPVLSE